jgi:hypothetical protein
MIWILDQLVPPSKQTYAWYCNQVHHKQQPFPNLNLLLTHHLQDREDLEKSHKDGSLLSSHNTCDTTIGSTRKVWWQLLPMAPLP